MEACLVNLLEPGDEAVVVRQRRLRHAHGRHRRALRREADPGRGTVGPHRRCGGGARALATLHTPKLVALVHAETSTGAWQPLEEIRPSCASTAALLVIDTVTSLGGCPVRIDEWRIDAAYSGTQKCLSCPPGLSPVTFGARAVETLRRRKSKVQSWYLDLTMIERYWGDERVYHHTAPISMNYALYEALRIVEEEGLEARWARHQRNHLALKAGLAAMGLQIASQEGHQLWTLNSVQIPEGVDDAAVRRVLLDEFAIEIGGGLGPLKGKTWRIGLMGESSTEANVLLVLSTLERVLPRFGQRIEAGAGVRGCGGVAGLRGGRDPRAGGPAQPAASLRSQDDSLANLPSNWPLVALAQRHHQRADLGRTELGGERRIAASRCASSSCAGR